MCYKQTPESDLWITYTFGHEFLATCNLIFLLLWEKPLFSPAALSVAHALLNKFELELFFLFTFSKEEKVSRSVSAELSSKAEHSLLSISY